MKHLGFWGFGVLKKKAEASSARVQGDGPTGVQGARHDCLMRGLCCRASVKRFVDVDYIYYV